MMVTKYLDKSYAEKLADDVSDLTEWHKHYSTDGFIDFVARRHTFINTRACLYRKKLTELGIDVDTLTEQYEAI